MIYRWQRLGAILVFMTILTILSSSLSALEFRDGQERVSYWFESDDSAETGETRPTNNETGFDFSFPIEAGVQIILTVLLWILIPIALLYSIFTRDGRRSLPQAILRAVVFGIIFFGLYILVDLLGNFLGGEGGGAIGAGTLLDSRSIPPAILIGTSAFVAIALLLAGWLIYKQGQSLLTPERMIAVSAETAIRKIDEGADLNTLIMRCYADMLNAARSVSGVERDEHVTPQEFVQSLHALGLPTTEVNTLTQLFETVRYGGQGVNSAERSTARACLSTIIKSCEQLKQPT